MRKVEDPQKLDFFTPSMWLQRKVETRSRGGRAYAKSEACDKTGGRLADFTAVQFWNNPIPETDSKASTVNDPIDGNGGV
jgi:hypothetical protein